MPVTLARITNRDAGFYPAMGPFLANHDVHTILGGVPWDEPTKTWILASDDEDVIGFLALNEKKTSRLESCYVVPGRERVRATLVKRAVKDFGHDRDLHATVRTELAIPYTAVGFVPVKETKNFTTLVRRADVRGETT